MTKRKHFIIGLGASAGGLEALSHFLESFENKKSDFSIIIAQHLSPTSKSMLVDILTRKTQLPVIFAKNETLLERGKIYVTPPDENITVQDEKLVLQKAPHDQVSPRPSIDVLFSSMAKTLKERAVAVIFSGTGKDGSLGIAEVMENGGLSVVQEPDSAKFPSMPYSAIQVMKPDYILPPRDVGKLLSGNLSSLMNKRVRGKREQSRPKDINDLNDFIASMKEKSGIDFKNYKKKTLERRLSKKMNELDIKSLSDLDKKISQEQNGHFKLAEYLLIPVTSFFRDPEAFERLNQELKAKFANEDSPYIRVWSIACSNGAEAYSVAILFEEMKRLNPSLDYKVYASDISLNCLDIGRKGRYPKRIMEQIPERYRERYFDISDDYFQVKKFLREKIVFTRHNILKDPPLFKMDLILCRNMLIYLDSKLQDRVLATVTQCLKPEGLFLQGKSESVTKQSHNFEVLDHKLKLCKKVKKSPLDPYLMRPETDKLERTTFSWMAPLQHPSKKRKPKEDGLFEVALKSILPAAVILDEEFKIIHILGSMGHYIDLPSGPFSNELIHIIHSDMKTEVSHLQYLYTRKLKTRKTSDTRPIHVSLVAFCNKQKLNCELKEIPGHKSCLISFTPIYDQRPKTSKSKREEKNTLQNDELQKQLDQTNHELHEAREYLQTAVEELEASNEELQSLNEELQASNEELQSSNEELESSNEELQSVNEELNSLNQELHVKGEELKDALTELEVVYNSVGFPIFVVDSEFMITKNNKMFDQMFPRVTVEKNERTNKRSVVELPENLTQIVKKCIETIEENEVYKDQLMINSSYFNLKATSVYSKKENNRFFIVSLIDETEVKVAQNRLKASESKYLAFINNSNAIISLKNVLGEYTLANKTFQEVFGVNESDILGRDDSYLFPSKVANRLKEEDLIVLRSKKRRSVEETYPTLQGPRDYLTNRFPILDEHGQSVGVGCFSIDVTESLADKAVIEEQRKQIETTSRLATIGEISSTLAHELNTPLSVLKLEVQSLKKLKDQNKLDSARLDKGIDRVNKVSERMITMTKALKNFSHDTSMEKFENVSVDDIIKDVLSLVDLKASDQGVHVEYSAPASAFELICRPVSISLALINLINNAVDAAEGTEEKWVKLKVYKDTHYCYFQVQDSGKGISSNDLKNIERPFFTTKEIGKGTGLGLSIAQKVVQSHGGSLIYDQEKEVTTFKIKIPLELQVQESL